MHDWHDDLMQRHLDRVDRGDLGMPASVERALGTINRVRYAMEAAGRLIPYAPQPPRDELDFFATTPPHWRWNVHSGSHLSLLGDIGEGYWGKPGPGQLLTIHVQPYYEEANEAWDSIAPICQANVVLREQLREAAEQGLDIVSPPVLRALRAFRDVLARFADKPPVADYVLELDQMFRQLADAARMLVIRRLFAGQLTGDEADRAVDLLKQQAEAGIWRDPDGDIATIEAELAAA